MSRTKGSALLVRSGKTQDEIAARIGVSRVAVSQWMNGATKPGPAKRGLLFAAFAIPESAWDADHSLDSATPTELPRVPDGALAKAEHLEAMAQQLMTEMRTDSEATPLERAKVMSSLASTLTAIAKLRGELDHGSKLFSLPLWKRIEAALERGLDGHPEAAAAVARELRKLDETGTLTIGT